LRQIPLFIYTRAILSNGPKAAPDSKMPRTNDDGEGASMDLGKRNGSTLGDAGQGSSSNAKKTKQDSTSGGSRGSGGAVAASVSDSDCNELVRFLKDKGLSSIAPQFSKVLGIDKIENLKDLIKEDLEDPCCAFLKPIHKRTLLRVAAESIAHVQSLRDDDLSSAETGSQGSVATSEAESSDESGDDQSSSFDAVSAKHLGNPADFQKHISGFIRDFQNYMSGSAPETATELFHINSGTRSHERSYCMLVVISRAFFLFFPCNHSVNINIIIFFFRRSKRQRNFSLFYFASQES
jgi:hypothetical protein